MFANPASPANHVPNLMQVIEEHGFAIIPDAIDLTTIDSAIADLERLNFTNAVRRRNNQIFGIRNLLNVVPSTKHLAENELIQSLARTLVGNDAKVVRSL